MALNEWIEHVVTEFKAAYRAALAEAPKPQDETLETIEAPFMRYCSLTSEIYALYKDQCCEICDCERIPFTVENVEKAFRFYEQRWQTEKAPKP
jgi:hypothetical protein